MSRLSGTTFFCLSIQPVQFLPSRSIWRHISLTWPFPRRYRQTWLLYHGTVSSTLLLNTDLAVAPLSLAKLGILVLQKFYGLIDCMRLIGRSCTQPLFLFVLIWIAGLVKHKLNKGKVSFLLIRIDFSRVRIPIFRSFIAQASIWFISHIYKTQLYNSGVNEKVD